MLSGLGGIFIAFHLVVILTCLLCLWKQSIQDWVTTRKRRHGQCPAMQGLSGLWSPRGIKASVPPRLLPPQMADLSLMPFTLHPKVLACVWSCSPCHSVQNSESLVGDMPCGGGKGRQAPMPLCEDMVLQLSLEGSVNPGLFCV